MISRLATRAAIIKNIYDETGEGIYSSANIIGLVFAIHLIKCKADPTHGGICLLTAVLAMFWGANSLKSE